MDNFARPDGAGRYANQRPGWHMLMRFMFTLRSFRGRRGIIPSVAAIAREMKCSARTVQRCRAAAADDGLIVWHLQRGPARSNEWHESRTNEYVIVGETRRERRWRHPETELIRVAYRTVELFRKVLAPYLLKGQDILKIVLNLNDWVVDNPEFLDPVALILRCHDPAARGRAHRLQGSGYCEFCGKAPTRPSVPIEWGIRA